MRRTQALFISLLTVAAVAAIVGVTVAAGHVRRVTHAREHPARDQHPRLAAGGQSNSRLVGLASRGGRVIVLLRPNASLISLARGLSGQSRVDRAQQAPIVSEIKRSGGRDVRQLTIVDAIAARVSASEARRLSTLSEVEQVVPDQPVSETVPLTPTASQVAPSQSKCTPNPAQPMIEPEALSDMNFEGTGPDEADTIADGQGVTVAIAGMNELAGNPNFTRADGSHVVIDAPDYNPNDIPNDPALDEWFGDASSVGAQGTVVYQYSSELPYSNLPTGCTFVIKGDAPGASLIDLDLVDPQAIQTTVQGAKALQISQPESDAIAGIQNAVQQHADVISQSYGNGGGTRLLWKVDDAAVQAGVTVVASSGDEGFFDSFIAPADDPNVIGVGATNTLRLLAQGYGYTGWVNDNITTLSSGGTGQNYSSPNEPGKYVDLVAPGYGGEAACSPLATAACPTNTQTEAFGGTSESAPFVAGAAADVIQAYSDSHGGARPSPAMVKQILTGSATDINSAAGQQGAGLVNIYAAVRVAQQEPGGTATGTDDAPSLVSDPTQVDVSGDGGTTASQTLQVFNASPATATVSASLRSLGPETQIGKTVTEPISAPPAGTPIPAEGAQAATPITFKVPAGLNRLNANMIWPDPTNSTILYYILTDPQGRLVQVSYDYGSGSDNGTIGTVPNIQHTDVANPEPGKWTATILWGNGRSHLQEPPNVPGSYTGPMSFEVTGQTFSTSSAGAAPVTIPANSTAPLTVQVPLSATPGDHAMSVQLSSTGGANASVPVLARTVIPSTGGEFDTTLGTNVGRGPTDTPYFIDVPAGEKSISVSFHTADASPDNTFTFWMVNPNGKVVVADATPTATLEGSGATTPTAAANLSVANPGAGRWLINVQLDGDTSGKEFSQVVYGNVAFNDSGVSVVSGLPTKLKTVLAQGTAQPVSLEVTNTTGVGRTFTFSSNQTDIAPVSAYIPAGVTQLVTLQLTPTAAVGTAVKGKLAVTTNTSVANSPAQPTLAILPYKYTVGPPVTP